MADQPTPSGTFECRCGHVHYIKCYVCFQRNPARYVTAALRADAETDTPDIMIRMKDQK